MLLLLICAAYVWFKESGKQASSDFSAWSGAARDRQAKRWGGFKKTAFDKKTGTKAKRLGYRLGTASWWTAATLTTGVVGGLKGAGRAAKAGTQAVRAGDGRQTALAAQAKYGPGMKAVTGAVADRVDRVRARTEARKFAKGHTKAAKAADKTATKLVPELVKAAAAAPPETVPYPYDSPKTARGTGGPAVNGWKDPLFGTANTHVVHDGKSEYELDHDFAQRRLERARELDLPDSASVLPGSDDAFVIDGMQKARDEGGPVNTETARRIAAMYLDDYQQRFADGSATKAEQERINLLGAFVQGQPHDTAALRAAIEDERSRGSLPPVGLVALDELAAYVSGVPAGEPEIKDSDSLAAYLNDLHSVWGYAGGDPKVKDQQSDDMPEWVVDDYRGDVSGVVRTPEGFEAVFDPEAQSWDPVLRDYKGNVVPNDGNFDPLEVDPPYWGLNATDLEMYREAHAGYPEENPPGVVFDGGDWDPTREENYSAGPFTPDASEVAVRRAFPENYCTQCGTRHAVRPVNGVCPQCVAGTQTSGHDVTGDPTETSNNTNGGTTMTNPTSVPSGESTGLTGDQETIRQMGLLLTQAKAAMEPLSSGLSTAGMDPEILSAIAVAGDGLEAAVNAMASALELITGGKVKLGQEYALAGGRANLEYLGS